MAGVVIGGVAVSLLARPRMTQDVDAMVMIGEDDWDRFVDSGVPFGFRPRTDDALVFARHSRVLLLQYRDEIPVDVSLGALPFESETIARSRRIALPGFELPVPTPEDLMVMKAVAHRDKDLGDMRSLLDIFPHMDLRRVRRWTADIAEVLDSPELVTGLEAIIARHRPHGASVGGKRPRRGKSADI